MVYFVGRTVSGGPGPFLTARSCLLVSAILSAASQFSPAADRIVLRNLDTITDREVRSFDEDGVRLDDDRIIFWDGIERATVARRSGDFGRMLSELGEPLYRIRQRMKIGDLQGVSEPAERLCATYAGRRGELAFLVMQAAMWSRTARGERESAVAASIECYAILREHPEYAQRLPGSRRPRFDAATGLFADLLPIWLDSCCAKEGYRAARSAAERLEEPRPDGIRFYLGSLALAGEDREQANRYFNSMSGTDSVSIELRILSRALLAIDAGDFPTAANELRARPEYSPTTRALSWYWGGLAGLRTAAHREGALDLLQLAALEGDSEPEVAAAALFHAGEYFERVGETRASVAVRKELWARFDGTRFARGLRSATNIPDSER